MFNPYITFGVVRTLIQNAYPNNENLNLTVYGICIVICAAVSYLLGQLNFAIILSKKKYGVDIRDYGSGNGGTTNMLRTFGKKMAIVTLVGDMGKAILSCLIGYILIGRLGAFLSGLFCILGHTMPIKYKFKGGKGVACAAAVILMTDLGNLWRVPVIFLALLLIFAAIAFGLKYVSLASVMCMLIYPLMLYEVEMLIAEASQVYIEGTGLYVIISLLMALLIIFMHRENIKRLLHGKESKLDLSKKKKRLYEESKSECDTVTETSEVTEQKAEKPNPNTSKKKIKRNKK